MSHFRFSQMLLEVLSLCVDQQKIVLKMWPDEKTTLK